MQTKPKGVTAQSKILDECHCVIIEDNSFSCTFLEHWTKKCANERMPPTHYIVSNPSRCFNGNKLPFLVDANNAQQTAGHGYA